MRCLLDGTMGGYSPLGQVGLVQLTLVLLDWTAVGAS